MKRSARFLSYRPFSGLSPPGAANQIETHKRLSVFEGSFSVVQGCAAGFQPSPSPLPFSAFRSRARAVAYLALSANVTVAHALSPNLSMFSAMVAVKFLTLSPPAILTGHLRRWNLTSSLL